MFSIDCCLLGPILQNYFCCNWTAIKLRQDFNALFLALNGFVTVNLHLQDESVLNLSSKHKYVHLKTHWASHTMHQNLAIILRQFNYGKNSFILLIPGRHIPLRDLLKQFFSRVDEAWTLTMMEQGPSWTLNNAVS